MKFRIKLSWLTMHQGCQRPSRAIELQVDQEGLEKGCPQRKNLTTDIIASIVQPTVICRLLDQWSKKLNFKSVDQWISRSVDQ